MYCKYVHVCMYVCMYVYIYIILHGPWNGPPFSTLKPCTFDLLKS